MPATVVTSSLVLCKWDDACCWCVCLPHLTKTPSNTGWCLIFLLVPRLLPMTHCSVVISAESLEADMLEDRKTGRALRGRFPTASGP